MARVTQARRVAALTLGDVRRNGARARDLLRESSRMRELDERDRALVSRLVLGVTATYGMLDACINHHLSKPKLEPKVRDALRLGAYELLFLATPTPVVVSQSVELVRLASRRAAGLANAVLRRIAQEDVKARNDALNRMESRATSIEDLALICGYPVWLLGRVEEEKGHEAACSMALSALEPAPVYVAANEERLSAKRTQELLDEASLGPASAGVEGAFALSHPAALATSGLVTSVDLVVSDLSAQRIVAGIELREGTRLLEVGQGRGTKSILVQNVARRRGVCIEHVGIDAEPFKVDVSRRRMERAGLSHKVSCEVFDACKLAQNELPLEFEGEFDVVFVDAPCSGVGTIRRHPEIAWALQPDDIRALTDLQSRILAAAAQRVGLCGSLYYSTCSILHDENEGIVDAFLASDKGAGFELASDPFQSIPTKNGPDGHFCAHLVRRPA